MWNILSPSFLSPWRKGLIGIFVSNFSRYQDVLIFILQLSQNIKSSVELIFPGLHLGEFASFACISEDSQAGN
jgi:hypothetical protein